MVRFADGFAEDADLLAAAERASGLAVAALAGRGPDLAAVFVCAAEPEAEDAALLLASRLTGARNTIGCAGPGVIAGQRAAQGASAVAVWAAVLPEVRLRTFHLEVMRTDRGMVVVGLPEQGEQPLAVLLADPFSFPVDGFVAQANATLPGVRLVGGVTPGRSGPESSRLLVDERVVSRGAVGVLMSGPVGARTAVAQGCRPVGPAMVVTRADGATVLELAGLPALARLESVIEMLGPAEQALASGGLQLGLAVSEHQDDSQAGDFVIRGIAGADRRRGALVVGDVVEVGTSVRLQVPDPLTADAELSRALADLSAQPGFDSVEGALLFAGAARSRILPEGAAHDAQRVAERLGPAGLGGLLTAGEIAPLAGRNRLHGLAAALLVFGSGPAAERGTAP